MDIKLTKREFELIKWINSFGFVDATLVTKKLNVDKSTVYSLLKKLVKNKLLIYERIFFNLPGCYRVTKKGTNLTNDIVSPIKKINVAKYLHDYKIVELSLYLIEKFKGEFVTERYIRHDDGFIKTTQNHHISDGKLIIGNKTIAIEVELSSKGKRRRQDIMDFYLKHFEFDEVWYFCGSNEIRNQLSSFTKKMFFLKIFDLESTLKQCELVEM